MMHYFKLTVFDTISFLNDLVCIAVYINRYPVAIRYFESIFTDMISVPMRYDNTIDPGWIQFDIF